MIFSPLAGRGDFQPQLDSAVQDVNDKYLLLEETEKQAVRKALIEERARFCSFVAMLRPVVVRGLRPWGHRQLCSAKFRHELKPLSIFLSGWRNVHAGRNYPSTDHCWWPQSFDHGPPQTSPCKWTGMLVPQLVLFNLADKQPHKHAAKFCWKIICLTSSKFIMSIE